MGERAPTRVRSVAVLGSCITRDNFNSRFNPGYKRWFRNGPSSNQSSMIAMMSPPVVESWCAVDHLTDYGLWTVRSDLSREILSSLVEAQPDLVILDFFGDVHFGVIRMPNGRFVTNNRWRLHRTDLYERLTADPETVVLKWQEDPDGYFALWAEAMDRFAAHVAEHCPGSRVILHRGFDVTTKLTADATSTTPFGRPRRRAAARARNRFWRRLHAHARDTYGWDEITLGHEHYATLDEHPWGAMEVHYNAEYNARFLARLHHLVLGDELDGDLMARVDAVADASAARIRDEVAWWRACRRARREKTRQSQRPRWKRVLRPARRPQLSPPPPLRGRDHDLLDALRPHLDEETLPRVESFVTSADRHVRWLREVGGSGVR